MPHCAVLLTCHDSFNDVVTSAFAAKFIDVTNAHSVAHPHSSSAETAERVQLYLHFLSVSSRHYLGRDAREKSDKIIYKYTHNKLIIIGCRYGVIRKQ